ncbi:sodium:calcium antiporter [Microvirga roseola]|uniref:sodium:calcium antiporter n=1 Tax=Microvirga roseola TaxID=2883126 RepID=UPI001E2C3A2D|nr:sodium:calcium exchanger [Microvirga roseola]
MGWFLWVPVLLAAVWAAHWGAEHLSKPLKKLRRQWGFSVAAGGSFVGLAAASPEIAINTTSAIRGVTDIGLGAMLGSNILAIPTMVTVAYFATRKRDLGQGKGNDGGSKQSQEEGRAERASKEGGQHSDRKQGGGSGGHQNHGEHVEQGILAVDRTAVTVQAIPYLVIVGIAALLTLPVPGRGLQPIDGWVMLAAYAVYLAQALLRGRQKSEKVEWKKGEIWKAMAGVGALVVGAYFTVLSTENIVQGLGVPRIIGGLFITAPVAALPEVFATWYVARSGQVTSAVTSVIGDHAVTMTIAFFPLALVTTYVMNPLLFQVNLVFVALVPSLYAAFIHFGGSEHGFKRWQVVTLLAVPVVWVFLIVFWVRPA